MLAEALEVGRVLVCVICRAVVSVGKGSDEEVLHVKIRGCSWV